MDDDRSLATPESFVAAIKRGCDAELAAGRSIIGTEPEYPGALIECTPDKRRFIVKLEGLEGARTFHRLREIPSAEK